MKMCTQNPFGKKILIRDTYYLDKPRTVCIYSNIFACKSTYIVIKGPNDKLDSKLREKESDLNQSYKKNPKIFDHTIITDRLRMVSWIYDNRQTGVV